MKKKLWILIAIMALTLVFSSCSNNTPSVDNSNTDDTTPTTPTTPDTDTDSGTSGSDTSSTEVKNRSEFLTVTASVPSGLYGKWTGSSDTYTFNEDGTLTRLYGGSYKETNQFLITEDGYIYTIDSERPTISYTYDSSAPSITDEYDTVYSLYSDTHDGIIGTWMTSDTTASTQDYLQIGKTDVAYWSYWINPAADRVQFKDKLYGYILGSSYTDDGSTLTFASNERTILWGVYSETDGTLYTATGTACTKTE